MKNKKIILVIVLVFLGIFGLISKKVFQPQNSLPPPFSSPYVGGGRVGVESEKVAITTIATNETKPAPIKSLPSKNTENITIIAGEEKINLPVPPNTLFYDALMQAKNDGILTVSGKNYPGMGFFVTDIETLHAGGGKDLLYYINNKEATVGVSSYVLKDGDILEWKLE